MIVKIDYVKGPEPASVIFNKVTLIRTLQDAGYKRLVIKYTSQSEQPVSYSTPMYLIYNIEITEE